MADDYWSYEEDFFTDYCDAHAGAQVRSPKTGKMMGKTMYTNLSLAAAIEEAVEAQTAELRRWLAIN
jgi:hypothetical protein